MKLGKVYKLQIISEDSLDAGELLHKCLTFLHNLALDRETAQRLVKAEQKLSRLNHQKEDAAKHYSEKEILFRDIFLILEDIAPEGCYFGGHPKNPVLIGFWEHSMLSARR